MRSFRFEPVPIALLGFVTALLLTTSSLQAQLQTAQTSPQQAMPGPPIQQITTATAVSTEPFVMITNVRELPNGSVLVSDRMRRRLTLLDSTLNVVRVVLDSLTTSENSYGTNLGGGLITYAADSTMFIDMSAYALIVLDPEGNVGRIGAVWRSEHVSYYVYPTTYGQAAMDAKGRIVYRIPATTAPPSVRPPPGVPYIPNTPDSAFIVAADPNTRQVDTLAVLRVPRSIYSVRRVGQSYTLDLVNHPLPATDDWAVLSDGTVAIVRARDYHIDYLNPDGSVTSSQRLPYEWQRLTDEDKDRFIDSVRTGLRRTALNAYANNLIRWANMYSKPYPPDLEVPPGFTLTPGFPQDWILPPGLRFPDNYIHACPPGVTPPTQAEQIAMLSTAAAGGAAGGAAPGARPPARCLPAPPMPSGNSSPPPPSFRPPVTVAPEDLPDYKPLFSTSGTTVVRADEDGNLWIRPNPTRSIPGGPVYDIVSRQGELVNRIQLPPTYTLVGFGKNKTVYLSVRDAQGLKLARVRLR